LRAEVVAIVGVPFSLRMFHDVEHQSHNVRL
jgi:hypothetical protein